jgi:hypothetical protein
MRTVVNSSEVFHLWAHQTQETARNGRDSASFTGRLAYSYQTPIGAIVSNSRGEAAFLVSTRSYSPTTGKHLSHLRQSIPNGALVFYVQEVGYGGYNRHGFTPTDELARYVQRIAASELSAKRARTHTDMHLRDAATYAEEATRFAEFFGLGAFDAATVKRLKEEALQAAARVEAARREEAKRAAEQNAAYLSEALPKWRAHEVHGLRYGVSDTDFLRLSTDTDIVETSRGARVPVRDAHVLYLAWTNGKHVEGFHAGPFTVHKATPKGIQIGCHYIARTEADTFAAAMGWQ